MKTSNITKEGYKLKLEKVEKIVRLTQLLNENPNISARELADRLNMNLRTVYYHLKQFQKMGIPTILKLKKGKEEKDQDVHVIYDEVGYLNLAFSQPQLSLIHKTVEERLQNPKELIEPEIQILKEAKELLSKALFVRPQVEATPASIKFLFEPRKGKYDGEIKIGFVGNLDMRNPLRLGPTINTNLLWLIFSTLFSYPKGEAERLLVESWEVSEDFLTWSFELKKGVKFHNGKELTAEDVAFTFRSVADPIFDSPYANKYSFVNSFKAISKHKFQVKLKYPHAALLDSLGTPILPKEVLQRYKRFKSTENIEPEAKTLLIGSGPFKLDSFPQKDVIILSANEDYFEEGYPHLERVILKAYSSSRALFDAIGSEDVDLAIFGLMLSELEQLGETIPFQVYPIDMYAYYALLLNLKHKVLSDIRVRKAISHAINRENLFRIQLRGYGSVSNGPLTPSSWAYNESLQPVKYDIELAKALLVKAGWKERIDHWRKGDEKLELEMAVAKEIPDLARLAMGLKLQLSKLKIKVNPKYISTRELTPGGFETALIPINCGGDPGVMLWRFWHSESKINLTSYHNPEVEDLLEWGRKVVSISKRKAVYHRVQELIVADHPAAFLCTSVCFIGSNCVLQNADEFLMLPNFFSSIKSWSVKR